MANTWSVTPSDGVINNNNGTFVFPENTQSSKKIYTITFSSDTCHCYGTTQITVEAAPTYTYGTGSVVTNVSCDSQYIELMCDNIPYTAVTAGGTEIIGTTTGTASVLISRCSDTGGCTTSDTVQALPNGYINYTVSQTGCSPTCTEETITRYGPYIDTASVDVCDPQTYNGSASQRIYSSITVHTDCSETLNSTGITSVASENYTITNIPKNTGASEVTIQLTGYTSDFAEVHTEMTIPTCCVAGTYHYVLNIPQIPQPGIITGPYDIYLCKIHQISNPLEAQSIATGGTKLNKVSTYYNVCDFEVDGSGNFVRLIGATDKINFVPTGGGNIVTTDFEIDKGYYICAVQTDDPTKFYPFGALANLKTQDISCADYTQKITN